MAQELVALLKDLESVFGGGQGRLLDQQICSFLGLKFLVEKPRAARVSLCTSRRGLAYYRAIDIRRTHAEDGRGNHPGLLLVCQIL